ncbi:hypothetical protein [Paenibacillus sp. FSL R10-2771]|uniref:hypothetical protein n=1 Tax=Paenibacillus sp. FSL R10-2771 TaxID=2954693 RepID=UPI0030FD0313
MINMEITYYFSNNVLKREEIENSLLQLVENVMGNESDISFTQQEESEEGEGDTLYVKCNFFSFTTTQFNVKSISRDFDIEVNYGLECNVYENGDRKFIEFLGEMLKSNIGEALLLKDSEYKILERKDDSLLVDSHFFNGDIEVLSLTYIQGTYKKFGVRIDAGLTTEEIKLESIKLVEEHEKEYNISVVEDPDYTSEFMLNWGDIQINISNTGATINLSCGHIFAHEDSLRLKKILRFFKQFTNALPGDYELSVKQGYWKQKRSTLVTRNNSEVTINNQTEEAHLLYEINFFDH